MKGKTMQYTLCHTCTCAVEYNDYSAFAFDPITEQKVIKWVEKVGMITHVEETDTQFFMCAACKGHFEDSISHKWSKD